jgi:hypothetical protein
MALYGMGQLLCFENRTPKATRNSRSHAESMRRDTSANAAGHVLLAAQLRLSFLRLSVRATLAGVYAS